MYLERIETTGLAHFSYLITDGGVAAVIDPRRDVEIYLEIARATVAASALLRCGYTDIDVFIGSFKAWRAADKPVEAA